MIRLIDKAGTLGCYRCRKMGKTHRSIRIIHVLSGKRAWDEVICRRCGSKAFIIRPQS